MQLPHNSRLIRLIAAGTLLLPAGLLLYGMWLYAVNVPFRDSLPYTFLLMEKIFLSDSVTLHDFLIPNGEHILLMPLMVMTGLAAVTGWNIRIEIFLIGILTITDAAMVIRLLSAQLRGRPVIRYSLSLLIVVMLCSPIHWESWTLSMVLSYALASTSFLCALSLLTGKRITPGRTVSAAILCCISSFSSPHGLLSWIAMFWVLIIAKYRKTAALFTIGFAMNVWLQRSLLQQVVALQDNYFFVLHNPSGFFRHFLTVLGAPFFPDTTQQSVALLIGIVIVAALAADVMIWRRSNEEKQHALTPWFALLIFFLASSLLISLGRGTYGLIGAYVSRYFAVTQYPGIIALVMLAILLPRARTFLIAVCVLVIATNGVFSIRGRIQWERTSILQIQAKSCLESYTTASIACLDWLYPWDIPMDHLPGTAAPLLEKMGFLDVFSIPAGAVFIETPDHTYGALEMVGSAPVLPELSGTGTTVSGWAILDDCRIPDHVILTSGKNHTMIAHTTAHLRRTDIKEQFGKCYGNAGWEVELRKSTPTRGIAAWAFDPSNNVFYQLKDGLMN